MTVDDIRTPWGITLGWTDDGLKCCTWLYIAGRRVEFARKGGAQFFIDNLTADDNLPGLTAEPLRLMPMAEQCRPKTQHGFTIGDTVKLSREPLGISCRVVGFTVSCVLVKYSSEGVSVPYGPDELRHW